MGVGADLYMCDVVKKFTFAISSHDEFLFYCSLHCGRQLHSRRKFASDKKWRGSEAGKPWTLKSGGLEPRSLTEVYAYDHRS